MQGVQGRKVNFTRSRYRKINPVTLHTLHGYEESSSGYCMKAFRAFRVSRLTSREGTIGKLTLRLGTPGTGTKSYRLTTVAEVGAYRSGCTMTCVLSR